MLNDRQRMMDGDVDPSRHIPDPHYSGPSTSVSGHSPLPRDDGRSTTIKSGGQDKMKALDFGKPISRSTLDVMARPLRIGFGLLNLVWSWIATAGIFIWIFMPRQLRVVQDHFSTEAATTLVVPGVVGLVFAFAITITEIISSDRHKGIHWFTILVLDTPFTAVLTYLSFSVILSQHYDVIPVTWQLTSGILSIIIGIVSAKFGEVLLFGRARR